MHANTQRRFGADAAEVSVESMNAAGYTAGTVLAARRLGPRTVARAAARKTARGVIRQWAGGGSAGDGDAAAGDEAAAKPHAA